MLQNNLELIIQYPDKRGYTCRGFHGLHLAVPTFVVFDGGDISDQNIANQLGRAFCQEVHRYVGALEESAMPCRGLGRKISCHALNEPSCLKILVRPAASGMASLGGRWQAPTADAMWLAKQADPKWQVIPILPSNASVNIHVPIQWQGINVSFWRRSPLETIWAVMQRVGLTPEESRLFISYVRRDTTSVADQLFEALTREGFDVFLDRCSVPVGVQFQERLMQDLCDKAMVVLLNSAGVSRSQWVEEEITIIKTYRLGMLELRFPSGEERSDIDSDFTRLLDVNELIEAGPDYSGGASKLSPTTLTDVVEKIKVVHGRALHRRRYELIDNFAAALNSAGRTSRFLSNGMFFLPTSGNKGESVVGMTVRPPELSDYCSLHQQGGVSANRAGWLISPSPFFLASRQTHVTWLGGLSNIQHANEAQITQLAANL
jgi:hypothetical protein